MKVLVLCGVSGCGKTTIGEAFRDAHPGWVFLDADDFHPPANKEKMRGGTPLTDEDRAPWIEALRAGLSSVPPAPGVVVAFSGLRRRYRDRLREGFPDLTMVLLAGTMDVISGRMAARRHEFMNPNLLRSQLETLEPPGDGEALHMIDVTGEIPEIVAALERVLPSLTKN